MHSIEAYLIRKKRETTERIEACRVIPGSAGEGLSWYPEIAYLKDSLKEHQMDLYCPHRKGPLPVILVVHADPVSGRKEQTRHFCMNLCKLGYAVFSVNYRLQPEVSLTDQIQDLADAAAYIQNMSIRLKMQSDNLFVVGDQGGAMLAYDLLAIQNDPVLAKRLGIQPAPIRFSAAAYLSGPACPKDSRHRPAGLPWSGNRTARRVRDLQPDQPGLVDHQPPTLFVTGTRGGSCSGIGKLTERFAEKEKPFRVIRFDNSPNHYPGFCVNDPELPESRQVLGEIASFFDAHRANQTY